MLNIILFDDDNRDHLMPLTATRPVCELRCGIMTIREKWEWHFKQQVSYITQDYLQEKYPLLVAEDNLLINGSLLPNNRLYKLIIGLQPSEAIISGKGELVAARLDANQFELLNNDKPIEELSGIHLDLNKGFNTIERLWDLFVFNDEEIERDFHRLTNGRKSQELHPSNVVYGKHPIFIEEGAKVMASTFNTESGCIYIGKDAEVMEGSVVRGPFAMCEHAVLKMAAKVYGATTLGPYCKIGGEVNNVIFTGYSSKAHDGFLGNSVIGEWCNFGADSNNSNLKNNYAEVKIWDYPQNKFINSGLQFCGLVMGDHSKCGINTMFNTGTVVGVSCNIFGAGFPRNFIPSFVWGGPQGMSTYKFEKAMETAEKVMIRRGKILDEVEKKILAQVFEQEASFRPWEN